MFGPSKEDQQKAQRRARNTDAALQLIAKSLRTDPADEKSESAVQQIATRLEKIEGALTALMEQQSRDRARIDQLIENQNVMVKTLTKLLNA